jgi:hypothetical protein
MRLLQTTSTRGVVHFMERANLSALRRRRNKTYKCLCGSYVSINGGIQIAAPPFKGKICARCAEQINKRRYYYYRLFRHVLPETWTSEK